jgi:ATP-binding cassette subfamily B protein
MAAPKPVKNPKKAFADLFRFMRGYWFLIVTTVILAAVSCVLMLIGPNMLGQISVILSGGFELVNNETVWLGVNMKDIADIAVVLVIIYTVMFITDYVQQFLTAILTKKISVKLRSDIAKKINKLPLRFYDQNDTGDIMGRITNDVDAMSGSLNQSLITVISSCVLVIGSGIAMFLTSWILAVIAIGLSILGFVAMWFIVGKSQKYFQIRADIFGKLNAMAEESFGNHLAVITNNAEQKFSKDFKVLLDEHYTANKRGQFLSSLLQPLMGLISNISFVAVMVVGASMAIKDPEMIGVIIPFMMYVRYFARPLGDIGNSMAAFQNAGASAERVFGFLNEKEQEDETHITKRLTNIKGTVDFSHVRFSYLNKTKDGGEEEKLVIKDFSIHVKAGSRIAIVGPTGAGKTTIVNLLMKFYKTDSGSIKIDGVSVNDITRENVHDLFAMVLQDTWLFAGTLRDNLCYNVPNVTDCQINTAVEAVGLHHFVETLPNGLNAQVTENSDISQGQRQLITIARAMLKNAPLLILDEATSSVDTRTEMLVQEAMEKLTKGRTSFIIAHRLSTIKNADIILVISEGDIAEQGSHEKLLSQNGLYAKLYNSQFADV